ncbi:Rha family transcriptional regulator [Pseudomonas sp. C2L12B]|nr:phage regulatory CII family protein [Pseudomonas typographi]MBD1554681.1 Rha family transcriptional regulator [Pseudomonas typographi]MBD1590238.1 Rha family transcriptional regulator [Pseudomonas typographi]
MEDFERTLHREVKAGGGTALAKRMGVNETRLLDCANPNREAHRMNLEMFGQVLTHLSEDGRRSVLAALANEFGYDVVAKAAPRPQALTASLINVGKEVAELTIAVHNALADNHVCVFEKQQIAVEIDHVRQSLDVMASSVKAA